MNTLDEYAPDRRHNIGFTFFARAFLVMVLEKTRLNTKRFTYFLALPLFFLFSSSACADWDLWGQWICYLEYRPLVIGGQCFITRHDAQATLTLSQHGDLFELKGLRESGQFKPLAEVGRIVGDKVIIGQIRGGVFTPDIYLPQEGFITQGFSDDGAATQIVIRFTCSGTEYKYYITRADPTPYTDGDLGSVAYFDFRNKDYLRRHPDNKHSVLYVRFFRDVWKKGLIDSQIENSSPAAKGFLERLSVAMAKKIENKLKESPKDFAAWENGEANNSYDDTSSVEEFVGFLYSTDIYCEAGWKDLDEAAKASIIAGMKAVPGVLPENIDQIFIRVGGCSG